jgi:DNA-binding response OmpR family regulator
MRLTPPAAACFRSPEAQEEGLMTTHFSTVPIEQVGLKSSQEDPELLPPVVLVVDDEPLIAETLATILNGYGLAAISAFDGGAALEFARLIPPQMLLSDVALPGMDGFTLAREITARIPDCEVILFSGQYSTSDLVAKHHVEGRDFLTLIKPVHPVDMLARVFEGLGRHGWPAPAGFTPRPLSPYEAYSMGSAAGPDRAKNGRKHQSERVS